MVWEAICKVFAWFFPQSARDRANEAQRADFQAVVKMWEELAAKYEARELQYEAREKELREERHALRNTLHEMQLKLVLLEQEVKECQEDRVALRAELETLKAGKAA